MLLSEISSVPPKSKYKNLPKRVIETLNYLVHDKGHVFRKGYKDPDMEKAFKLCGEKYDKPLYRGVSEEELNMMLSGSKIDYYTSFSKDKNVAKRFGKFVVEIKKAPNIFDYELYSIWDLTRYSSKEYKEIDGDYMKQGYEEEKEVIMPFGTKYKVISKSKLIFEIIP
jgi:hypothetical protein